MIDKMDLQIIEFLKQDAKMKLQDIGDKVHLTGQAVSNRISKLEKSGIIKGYTALIDESYLNPKMVAYITVIMGTANHEGFKRFLERRKEIIEAHRISGDGCYMIKVEVGSKEELTQLLDGILAYGNYRVNISIAAVK
ncbi:MAG: Lrp/AsnC family transcriptional regulator [Cellulosilyticum sp.]|nr:Lrp/AsnC family transcriptional regulator [Cellulosilyticum sp.]